jgi:ammonium transporter, Amt family
MAVKMSGTSRMRLRVAFILLMLFSWTAVVAMAEEPAAPPAATELAQSPIDTGDNAWMLTSSALVLMMTAPGLALFYCGLVRKKNVLNVMMQCIFLMAMMGVIWALWGYSLSFGGDGAWLGNGDFFLLHNVQAAWSGSAPVFPVEGTIPRLTHMLFQGMFFIITPALMVGAFAERMKFSTMVVFMLLWGTLVYCPLCHWVWDAGGILFYGGRCCG